MVFHGLEQGVDHLAPEIILATALRQRIGFVDEQHTPQRRGHHLARLDGRLPHIPRHQPRAVHLNDMVGRDDAQAAVQVGHDARHRRLAGAGVAGKHQVLRKTAGYLVAGLFALALDAHKVKQALHLLLDALQTNQPVKALEHFFVIGGHAVGHWQRLAQGGLHICRQYLLQLVLGRIRQRKHALRLGFDDFFKQVAHIARVAKALVLHLDFAAKDFEQARVCGLGQRVGMPGAKVEQYLEQLCRCVVGEMQVAVKA